MQDLCIIDAWLESEADAWWAASEDPTFFEPEDCLEEFDYATNR